MWRWLFEICFEWVDSMNEWVSLLYSIDILLYFVFFLLLLLASCTIKKERNIKKRGRSFFFFSTNRRRKEVWNHSTSLRKKCIFLQSTTKSLWKFIREWVKVAKVFFWICAFLCVCVCIFYNKIRKMTKEIYKQHVTLPSTMTIEQLLCHGSSTTKTLYFCPIISFEVIKKWHFFVVASA